MPRRSVEIERENFNVVADFSVKDVTTRPAYPRRWFSSNFLQRGLSYLLGWTGSRFVRIAVTDAGWVKTTASPVTYEHNETFSGNAADTYTTHTFSSICSEVDVFVWDNAAIIQRSYDGAVYDDEIEISANTVYSFTIQTTSIRIKNKTAGNVARYQIVGAR